MAYWWCLEHKRVEGDEGCANLDRMGPYETREQAESAISRARERTKEWDAQDEAWRNG